MWFPRFSSGAASILLLLGLAGQAAAMIDWWSRACADIMLGNEAYATLQPDVGYLESYGNYCYNVDYARTMVDCIVTASQMPQAMATQKSMIDSWKVSWEFCDWLCDACGFKNQYKWDDVFEMNMKDPITTTYMQANYTGGPLLFHIDEEMLAPWMQGSIDYHTSRKWAQLIGQIHLIYILGVFGIQIFVNFVTWAHPLLYRQFATSFGGRAVRRHISVPPMLPQKPANATGTHIPRLPVFFLFGLLILEIVSYFVVYSDVHATPLWDSTAQELANYIGLRAGYYLMYKLPLLLLFAGRNNFLIWLTGWGMDVFNLWHRWLARIITIEAIIHAAGYSYQHLPDLAEVWTEDWWILGFVSLMCWAIMCVQGVKLLRRLSYEIFLVVHIVLALLSMIGLYWHLWYTDQCKQEWYAAWAVWGFDRIVRGLRLWRNGGVRRARAWSPGRDLVALDVPMPKHWESGPGAFVYLHFATPTHFYQSHPFTVVPASVADPRAARGATHMKLVFKARTGLTRRILNQILASPDETATVKVLVDGAYGVGINFAPYDTLLFVAGGIGITAVYSQVRAVSLGHASGAPRRVRVDWLVRNLEAVACFGDELAALGDLGVRVVVHITGESQSEEASVRGLPDVSSSGVSPSSGSDTEKTGALPTTVAVPLGQGLVRPDFPAPVGGAGAAAETLSIKVEVDGNTGTAPVRSLSSSGASRDLAVVYDRPTGSELVLSAAIDADTGLHVFACGPPGLNRDLRAATANALARYPGKLVQFSEEGFAL